MLMAPPLERSKRLDPGPGRALGGVVSASLGEVLGDDGRENKKEVQAGEMQPEETGC